MKKDGRRKPNTGKNRRNKKNNPNAPFSKNREAQKASTDTESSDASAPSQLSKETSSNNTGSKNTVNTAADSKPETAAESKPEATESASATKAVESHSAEAPERAPSAAKEVKTAPDTTTQKMSENKIKENVADKASEKAASAELATKPATSAKDNKGEKKTMSTTNTSSEKTEAKKANKTAETAPVAVPPPQQKSGSGFATTLATFAFLLSVAAGGGIYWMWQQLLIEKNASSDTIAQLQQQLQQEMQKSQSSIKAEVSQATSAIKQEVSQTQEQIKQQLDSKAQELQTIAQTVESSTSEKITQAQENLTKAQAELGKANHGIKETQKRQQSLEVSIEGLYARLGNTSGEWAIAEADYLLKVANHRLQLEEDVTTALQALELADKRLKSLDDPALNEVRNIIAQEIISLQTLPIPDQTGIAMQLTKLQDEVDQLPLNARTQPTHKDRKEFTASDAPQLEGWEAVPGAVMETLKGLVVVSYNDKPIEPLLSPEQIRNLHENLKLKLEQARIVLFRGDQDQYTANMQLAIDWTEKHFNTEEVPTKKFIDTLAFLKDKQVQLKVPDISSSLRSLRNASKRMELNIPSLGDNAKKTDDSTNVAMN